MQASHFSNSSCAKVIFTLLILMISSVVSANECPSVLKHFKRKLNSQEMVNLCDEYQGKVVLFVNTASYCSFTPQYDGLESLYSKYKEDGLVVLGFPSHDFNQEFQDEAKIAKLCRLTYKVQFPMFEPLKVKGDEADVLFRQLTMASGVEPRWNFYKFLMDREGNSITGFSSITKPWDESFVNEIELALNQ